MLTHAWSPCVLSVKGLDETATLANKHAGRRKVCMWKGPRVRMGMHVGRNDLGDGGRVEYAVKVNRHVGSIDVVGPAFRLAQEVSDAAYGGQVLLTQECVDRIREEGAVFDTNMFHVGTFAVSKHASPLSSLTSLTISPLSSQTSSSLSPKDPAKEDEERRGKPDASKPPPSPQEGGEKEEQGVGSGGGQQSRPSVTLYQAMPSKGPLAFRSFPQIRAMKQLGLGHGLNVKKAPEGDNVWFVCMRIYDLDSLSASKGFTSGGFRETLAKFKHSRMGGKRGEGVLGGPGYRTGGRLAQSHASQTSTLSVSETPSNSSSRAGYVAGGGRGRRARGSSGLPYVKDFWSKLHNTTRQIMEGPLKAWMQQYAGYEVRVRDTDMLLLVFKSKASAMTFCMVTQIGMMLLDWPPRRIARESMGRIRNAHGDVIYSGPRISMAVIPAGAEGKDYTRAFGSFAPGNSHRSLFKTSKSTEQGQDACVLDMSRLSQSGSHAGGSAFAKIDEETGASAIRKKQVSFMGDGGVSTIEERSTLAEMSTRTDNTAGTASSSMSPQSLNLQSSTSSGGWVHSSFVMRIASAVFKTKRGGERDGRLKLNDSVTDRRAWYRSYPATSCSCLAGSFVSPAEYLGKKHLVLFFYFSDKTNGCTMEAKYFRDCECQRRLLCARKDE